MMITSVVYKPYQTMDGLYFLLGFVDSVHGSLGTLKRALASRGW